MAKLWPRRRGGLWRGLVPDGSHMATVRPALRPFWRRRMGQPRGAAPELAAPAGAKHSADLERPASRAHSSDHPWRPTLANVRDPRPTICMRED